MNSTQLLHQMIEYCLQNCNFLFLSLNEKKSYIRNVTQQNCLMFNYSTTYSFKNNFLNTINFY